MQQQTLRSAKNKFILKKKAKSIKHMPNKILSFLSKDSFGLTHYF